MEPPRGCDVNVNVNVNVDANNTALQYSSSTCRMAQVLYVLECCLSLLQLPVSIRLGSASSSHIHDPSCMSLQPSVTPNVQNLQTQPDPDSNPPKRQKYLHFLPANGSGIRGKSKTRPRKKFENVRQTDRSRRDMSFAAKRLGKELAKIHGTLPPGIILVSAEGFQEWLLDIKVLDANPLYMNQTYRLKFKFSPSYPIEPPEVTFHKTPDRPIPIHPHIYSNGIICLDLLGTQGWSPVQNVESICMSLQSMLTGNTKNERPEGDEQFVANNRRRPRDIDFYYHDNTV